MYIGSGRSESAQEEDLSVGKVQIGKVRGLFPWRFAQSGAASKRAHGSSRQEGFPRSTPLLWTMLT